MDSTPTPLPRRLWDGLASLQVTIIALALLMALVVLCTLAQTKMGLYGAVQVYMRSFLVWWHIPALPFRIPVFPGGVLVGLVLALNLTTALINRFDFSWNKSGLWITHAGLILLVMGEFSTGAFQVETSMAIEEGQTVNFTESSRDVELAITNATEPSQDLVYSVPASLLRRSKTVAVPGTPIILNVKHYFQNAALTMRTPTDPPSLATAGVGADVKGSGGQDGKDLLASVKADKKLTIGTSNDPPWSAVEGGKEPTGIVPDILREVLDRAGIDAEIESLAMPFDSLIPSLQSGKIQMIGDSIYATEERDEVIDFSRILFYNPPALVVKKGNPDGLSDLSDLCGKVGATYKGTTFVDDLEAASQECAEGSIEVKLYDTLFAAMQDVAAGRVDGALIDASNSAYALFQNPDIDVELAEGFVAPDREGTAAAVAITEDNKAFLDMFNPVYDEMLKDGTAAEIFESYGMTPPETWLP